MPSLRLLLLQAVCLAGALGCQAPSSPSSSTPDHQAAAAVPVPPPQIGWPLRGHQPKIVDPGDSPYTHDIITVFDHADSSLGLTGRYSYRPHDFRLVAYGNVIATTTTLSPNKICYDLPGSGPIASQLLQALGVHYTGPYGDPACADAAHRLSYDNHPGYDFRADSGTEIWAPFAGTVSYKVPGTEGAPQPYHSLTLCSGNSCGPSTRVWRARFLHLSSYPLSNGSMVGPNGKPCPRCPREGAHVTQGQFIGYSGNFSPAMPPLGPHLHFEIVDPNGVPRDPYGWNPAWGADPLGQYTNGNLWLQLPPASISVTSNVTTTWTINPGALAGSGTAGTYSLTPAPSGTIYTITPAPITGQTFTVTNSNGGNSALTLFPGESKGFNIAYSATSAWASVTPLPAGRSEMAVATVNGILYVFGGGTGPLAYPTYQVFAYDPATRTWTGRNAMPTPGNNGTARSDGAQVLSGKVYIAGGIIFGGGTDPELRIYDPSTDTWGFGASMPAGSAGGVSGVINGKLYVLSGTDSVPTNTFYEYNPTNDTWAQLPSIPHIHVLGAGGVINGLFYVAGGHDGAGIETATLDVFDPIANQWTAKAPIPTPRFYPAGIAANGKLFVIGGYLHLSGALGVVEVYDPSTDTWKTAPPMPTARYLLGVGIIGNFLYAIGGSPSNDYVEALDLSKLP